MRVISSVMASGAQRQISGFDPRLFHLNKSLRRERKMREISEADFRLSKKRVLHVFQLEHQVTIYTKAPGCKTVLLAVETFSLIRVGNGHPFFEKRSDMRKLARDSRPSQKRIDSFSASAGGQT